MLCENCGKNYANVRYTQIINGVKKEIAVCEECSKKLGIDHFNFDMPIDFSSYLSEFFGEYDTTNILPIYNNTSNLQCQNCKMTFEEFINKGKFGCKDCYDAFKEKIDPLLKNIQGSNRHVGRLGKIKTNEQNLNMSQQQLTENTGDFQKDNNELEQLRKQLKLAIKDERYEEAAQLRDKIKKLENK